MKFCPECGLKLPTGTVQSCSNCGMNLWPNTISDTTTNIALPQRYTPPSVDVLRKEDEIREFQNQKLYSLLTELQKTIDEILKNNEYFPGQKAAEPTNYREARLVEPTNYREARLVEIMKPSSILSINVSINLSSLL